MTSRYCNEDQAHYWVIETPNGAWSQGVCKNCGAEKKFRNSTKDFTYFRNYKGQSPGQVGGHGKIKSQIARELGEDELRRLWRQKAQETHPDHGGSAEAFQRAKAAAEKLGVA